MRVSLFKRSVPDPDHIAVRHGVEIFQVSVRRRAAARRFTLRVSNATGEAVLTLPERSDLSAARRFVEAQSGWLAVRLKRVPDRVAFAADAEVPLRGIPHRVVHWSMLRGLPEATTDATGAPILTVTGEAPHVPRRILDFLKREAARDLGEAVARHTKALGIPARSISIRDTTSRWGSCSAQGRLNFSWRLILAPPYVLDYLAAHEVAHLKEMNHSERFWRLTRRLCARTDEAEAWLKRHGSALHRFG